MPEAGYNHGKIHCLAVVKNIKDKESNGPSSLEECDKLFHWKHPLFSCTTKESFSVIKHVTKILVTS